MIKSKTVYCHFSFRRKRGEGWGYFAVAFYSDFEGKNLVAQITRKQDLWEDQQFVSAVQAYEHALRTISDWQGVMRSKGIGQVMLVTDNSTLAGWIVNPKQNKAYTKYMKRATERYRTGGPKEITLGVGLCEPREYEKSYKFCRENKVANKEFILPKERAASKPKKFIIDISDKDITTADSILKNAVDAVEIVGMNEID